MKVSTEQFYIDLNNVLKTLNLNVNNVQLFEQAFSHSSFIHDQNKDKLLDNERLEFLGDAVLELVVSNYLFTTHSDMSEGQLTKLRAAVVCEPSLVTFAKRLDFPKLLLLGRGEEKTGGRTRPAIIADVFEAFLGALYLDQGLDVVQQFARHAIFPHINETLLDGLLDYKTLLQEYVHQLKLGPVEYVLISEEGPAHFKQFTTEVVFNGNVIGVGSGRSKKEAQQNAAKIALNSLTVGE